MDCWEDPHWRSTVVAGMVSGNPAASQALRPMLRACSPTCETHPVMLSSISPGSTPARATTSFRTSAKRSTGWMSLSEPFRLPIGLRTASTMTASLISGMGTLLFRILRRRAACRGPHTHPNLPASNLAHRSMPAARVHQPEGSGHAAPALRPAGSARILHLGWRFSIHVSTAHAACRIAVSSPYRAAATTV